MAYNPVSEAWQVQRRLNGTTANPNATPVGRGLRERTMQPWGMQTAAGPVSTATKPEQPAIPQEVFTKRRVQATMPDAMQPGYNPSASATPRLDRVPRTNPNAAQDSARSGAFGTGAQNRQRRWDLFNEMGKAGGNLDQFKGRAAALGVTTNGWDAAMRRLNMAKPAQSMSASNQSGVPSLSEVKEPSAADLLKTNAPLPPVLPTPPLPNQTPAAKPIAATTAIPWSIAKPNPYAVRPTTGDMTIADARKTTQDAIAIGKTPAPHAAAIPAAPPVQPAPVGATPAAMPAAAAPAMPVPAAKPTWQQTAGINPALASVAGTGNIGPVAQGNPRPDPINSKDPATRTAAMRKRKNKNWSDPLPNQPGWAASAIRWASKANL